MEIWKFIGNSNQYMISNYGNVKSFKRDSNGTIMKQTLEKGNYKRVMISYPKARTKHLVQRLVASAFIPNIENKCCVNHIDNNPSNNHVSNLEWCTYSENLIHAEKQGRLYEVHQKAGKATGYIAKTKKINEIEQFIKEQKKFNDLIITKLVKVDENIKSYVNMYFVECKCLCGKKFETDFSNIRGNIIKRCKTCKSTTTKLKNYNDLKNNLIGKNYKFVKIISMSDFEKEKEKSDISILTECLHCSLKKEVRYKHLIRKKRFLKCESCGNN